MSEEPKKKINRMFFEEYENDYNHKLFSYQQDNPHSTPRDFIIFMLNDFNSKRIETERIFNLNDDNFFKYLIENDKYVSSHNETANTIDGDEKKEYLQKMRKHYIAPRREKFRQLDSLPSKVLYYKMKLKNLPTEQKSIEVDKDEVKKNNTIQWLGTKIELVELFLALHASKKIDLNLSKKESFKRFSEFFDVAEEDIYDKERDAKKRQTLTPFLHLLESSLTIYFKKDD
jgi:hypothetical protein